LKYQSKNANHFEKSVFTTVKDIFVPKLFLSDSQMKFGEDILNYSQTITSGRFSM